MKKNIFIIVIAISTMATSCNNNSKKEEPTGHEHEGHHHNETKVHPEAYICPVNCDNGKTFILPGKCVVCKLDLVEQEHTIGDEHDNPSKEKKENKKSSINIDQPY